MVRARIVKAAGAATAELGWEAMRSVQQRAGVSNGSLFHHFPSRDALAADVIGHGLADHQETLSRVLDAEPDGRGGVRAVVVAHLD